MWIWCFHLSVYYFKVQKYLQNTLTNPREKRVDTVTLHEPKQHFPAAPLPKWKPLPPSTAFPHSLSSPSQPSPAAPKHLVMHGCVNSACMPIFKITFSPTFLGIYRHYLWQKSSFIFLHWALFITARCSKSAFKIRGTVLFLQGEAKPVSVMKPIWRRWVFAAGQIEGNFSYLSSATGDKTQHCNYL